MTRGLSIHVGLNAIDPGHYGVTGKLLGCEADAKDMLAIARMKGYDPTILLTRDATAAHVVDAIRSSAAKLQTGDILFLSYSGHGGQVPDTNGDDKDGLDETWCLYDRQLIDDELYMLWGEFKPGVRILVVSDSCHSGDVIKIAQLQAIYSAPSAARGLPQESPYEGTRALPPEVRAQTYANHRDLYDQIERDHPDSKNVQVTASVMLLAACQDHQYSMDGKKNGLFTETLLKVWNGGKFKGGYRLFYHTISDRMPLWQTPDYSVVGTRNEKFTLQSPFTVE